VLRAHQTPHRGLIKLPGTPHVPRPNIPHDWSPEQALAICQFLDALRDCGWIRYQDQNIAQFRAECGAEKRKDAQLELPFFPVNDEIPF